MCLFSTSLVLCYLFQYAMIFNDLLIEIYSWRFCDGDCLSHRGNQNFFVSFLIFADGLLTLVWFLSANSFESCRRCSQILFCGNFEDESINFVMEVSMANYILGSLTSSFLVSTFCTLFIYSKKLFAKIRVYSVWVCYGIDVGF